MFHAIALSIAGCAPAGPECAAPHPTDQRATLELLDCTTEATLCNSVVHSEVSDEDLATTFDLVFVPDGFDDFHQFNARVQQLLAAARADSSGILARAPELFNVHLIEPSPGLLADGEYPFGSCRATDPLDGSTMLASQVARVERAAAGAPDIDVIVLLSAGVDGRANTTAEGRWPLIRIGEQSSDSTLTHELGHAIFFLGDEYTDVDEAHPLAGQAGRPRPNVSFSPDDRWDGLTETALEGALRYRLGAYRPTNQCRMLDSEAHDRFCPVCDAHIDRWIAERRGAGSSAPTCYSFRAINGSRLVCWDVDGLTTITVGADTPTPQELNVAPCATCPAPRYFEQDFDDSFLKAGLSAMKVRDASGASTSIDLQ